MKTKGLFIFESFVRGFSQAEIRRHLSIKPSYIMKIKYFLIFIQLILLSCNQNLKVINSDLTKAKQSEKNNIENTTAKNVAEHYKTDKFDVAIFPKEYKEFLPEKRFTPTKSEIILAELALENQLKKVNRNRPNQSSSPVIDKNLNKYKRQYFGGIDENERKYLLINCFWSETENSDAWLNGMVIVLDGGSYYWQIKYYIDTNELRDLMVNGYA
ncbi:MAG: hypothetical protein PHC38_09390 [Weeksellaceae bacterium]|jgi:hypothetical protein|nr:hypothetical protein [Weeksellaceae bacterium]